MRQIDNMSDTEIDILHLKGMLSTTVRTSTQQGKIEKDYEPEQKYGSAADIQEHTRYGGTREDY